MKLLGWKYDRTGIAKEGSQPKGLEYTKIVRVQSTVPRPIGWTASDEDQARWRVYLRLKA